MDLGTTFTRGIWLFRLCSRGLTNSRIGLVNDILSCIKNFDEIGDTNSYQVLWLVFGLASAAYRGSAWTRQPEVIAGARLLLKYGAEFDQFLFLGQDILYCTHMVHLYLDIGGDPNKLDHQFGNPLLFATMFHMQEACRLFNHDQGNIVKMDDRNNEIEGAGEEEDEEASEEESAESLCVDILATLISSGADIYHIKGQDNVESAVTPTLYAIQCGVEEFWRAALEECSLDVSTVYAESDRRLAEYRKLRGAIRTGIDVEPLVERNLSSELRYRGR